MSKKYIVMAGTAGAEAALKAFEQNRETAEKRFPVYFLRKAENLRLEEEKLKSVFEGGIGAEYVLKLKETGILSALWKLGENLSSGLEADMDKIPLDQFTIEISELFGLNPYEEAAGNGYLFVTENPEEILEICKTAEIRAGVLGYLTNGTARTALTAEGVRYLNPEKE